MLDAFRKLDRERFTEAAQKLSHFTGVKQLTDAPDDPVDLLVEVVDEPDTDVVTSMVDFSGLHPGNT